MPINGNPREKLIFVKPEDANEQPRTFRLNAKNQVTEITKDCEQDPDYLATTHSSDLSASLIKTTALNCSTFVIECSVTLLKIINLINIF